MIPLSITETDREGFDEPVVELWRADDFVGMVFWDDDAAVAQVFPDDSGDVYDLPLSDLVRVLDLAEQIVTPDSFLSEEGEDEVGAEATAADWEDEHPATVALVGEFDPLAAHRTADGESFFARPVALELIGRCDQLDLAVVEMDGFDLVREELRPRARLMHAVRLVGMDDWPVFRPGANALAVDKLEGWPERETLVVAFVVQQPDGETFVA